MYKLSIFNEFNRAGRVSAARRRKLFILFKDLNETENLTNSTKWGGIEPLSTLWTAVENFPSLV